MKTNKLYLECFSGISGDMVVAALLDIGADERVLEEALDSLPITGFQTQISRVKKAGLDACDFNVILEEEYENHDHDMSYLHGENHNQEERYREQRHEKHHCDHEHRGMDEILQIIDAAKISERARKTAIRIFTILGEAEAKAHGTALEKVHFHEVGAVDSIVDIIAAAVCLDNLDIKEVVIPVLYEGSGSIRCQHGILPVPVPAVANIAAEYHLHLHMTAMEAELVTPTGAAIAAAIGTSDKLPERFAITKIGIGAGKRNYEKPSLLRAMLITLKEGSGSDVIYKLESNIDDSSGENLGHVMSCLLEAGAKDVNYMPLYMKKNRPAYQLNVICKEGDIDKLEQLIFAETTTIGIRRIKMERTILKREIKTVHTSLGEVQIKVCELPEGKRIYPEYESVADICRSSGKPYRDVYRLIERECYEQFEK